MTRTPPRARRTVHHLILATAAIRAPRQTWGYYTVHADTFRDARAVALRDFMGRHRGRWVVANDDPYGPRGPEDELDERMGPTGRLETAFVCELTAAAVGDSPARLLKQAIDAGVVEYDEVDRGRMVGFRRVPDPVWRWPREKAGG